MTRPANPVSQSPPRASKAPITTPVSLPRWARPLLLVAGGLAVAAVFLPQLRSRPRSPEASAAMPPSPAPIDGTRAFRYLQQICDLGPRIAGSESNTRQREMVAAHFREHGATVTEQPFSAPHPLTGKPVALANLIGSWHPQRNRRVVIAAHYDTRPFPDEERDPARRRLPFLGANDGASGVALLMEIAHHLNDLETPWGVDLVLFDAEELVYGRHPETRGEYFLGSKEFARRYLEAVEERGSPQRYVAGVVLDMVGGKNLRINQEPHSLNLAPDLVREIWSIARRIGARSFRDRIGREVLDDHLPLNNVGIPTIDLIDFDYPYWHKVDDIPANCAPESLQEVGRVVTAWLAMPRSQRIR
jgi:glutaminyl-peptide cyclotransferase